MRLAVVVLDAPDEGEVVVHESLARGLLAAGSVVGGQVDDRQGRLDAVAFRRPGGLLLLVEGLQVAVRHEIAGEHVAVVARDAHPGMRHEPEIGAEMARDDGRVGAVAVFRLRREGIGGAVAQRAVAAGVGVSDKFDYALAHGTRLQEAVRAESVEGGAALLALGALLDDDPVRVGRPREERERGVAAGQAEGGVGHGRHRVAVDPDVEIILPGAGGAQLQRVAAEMHDGIDAAPVEGDVAAADLGAADPGDAGVGSGEFLRGGAENGRGKQEDKGEQVFGCGHSEAKIRKKLLYLKIQPQLVR